MFCYASSISNIYRFFLEILKSAPSLTRYWLNGRWFLQIVDIGNFNMKLNGRWFPQIVGSCRSGQWKIYIQYIYIYTKLWCWLLNLLAGASEPVGGRSQATELPCCYYKNVHTLILIQKPFTGVKYQKLHTQIC